MSDRWYRFGQVVGLWHIAVEDRGVVTGTLFFLFVGGVALLGRQAAHDVQQITEGES